MAKLWIGIDAGKQAHHAAAIDEAGGVLWSVRVVNDQAALSELVARVPAGDDVCWAVDLIGCETALLRAVLIAVGHPVIYVPGRTVKAMAGGFPGEAKTDARDAVVIANTARMRRDLAPFAPETELVAALALLVAHRADLVQEWVRNVNRLRRLMTGICPALERALSFTNVATLILLSRYQTPRQLRDAADLATGLLALRRRIKDIDKAIEAVFADHPQARVMRSLPGMGRCRIHRRCRGPVDLSHLGPLGLLRWSCSRAPRLRTTDWQPAPAPALQPTIAARVLHGCHDHPAHRRPES